MKHINFNALALVLLLPLSACGPSGSQSGDTDHTASAASNAGEPTTSFIGAEVRKGMQQAKLELATKNISINNVSVHVNGEKRDSDDSRPKAEITPQGDLLIAGKEVAATPAQHALLLDYRQEIVGIAETGMDIGTQGADLGINAAKQAMWGALSGKSDKDIEASIKPQTDKIEASAAKLCLRMPNLLSTQQKLANAMPSFDPTPRCSRRTSTTAARTIRIGAARKVLRCFPIDRIHRASCNCMRRSRFTWCDR